MASSSFKHNKKRNSGLIYEFLIRKISESLLENDRSSYDKAIKILKNYFSSGNILSEEKELFDTIIETRGVSKKVSEGILNEVKNKAAKLNHSKIDREKSRLIKEINVGLGKDFFSEYKLENYRVLASIQLIKNGCNPRCSLNESVQRCHLEESISNYMTIKEENSNDEYIEVDNLVYSIAIRKFNERYNNSLNESQKKLLKEYVLSQYVPTKSIKLSNVMRAERKKMLESIDKSFMISEVMEDEQMEKKLKEAKDILCKIDVDSPSSLDVEEMMLFSKLVEEIESNG